MPNISRIHSSDSQIFFNGERIVGAQSSSLEIKKSKQDIPELGLFYEPSSIKTSNQTTNFNLTSLAILSGFNPFETGSFISVDKNQIRLIDTAGEMIVQDSYLTSCDLNIALNEIPSISTSFEADHVTFDAGTYLSPQIDQTTDSNVKYYRPQEIEVITDFEEGVSSNSFCLESVSLSVPISRSPINKMGKFSPSMRYPSLPTRGSLNFKINKTDLVDIDLSPLVLDKGSMSIALKGRNGGSNQGYISTYSVSGCSFISASESKGLDGNTSLDFTYDFPLTKKPVTVTNGLISLGNCELWENPENWISDMIWC